MGIPTSLTLRLTLLFGFAAAVVFSGFGWFIERSIEHHFVAEDTAELGIISQTVFKSLSSGKPNVDSDALEQRFADILVGHHGAILFVTDLQGRTLFASHTNSKLAAFIEAGDMNSNYLNILQHWDVNNNTYRVLIREINGISSGSVAQKYRITVAVAIDSHQNFLDSFRNTLWVMIVSSILITALMGWIAVQQGHAPLRRIVSQIQKISANELNTRLSPDSVPRELSDLAVSFNEMLARMEEAFVRLSNFSADIAHELRTPVTNLLTQTQVSLSKTRTTEEYREILYSNIEEYEHMAQMIGDMLFLAKADNGLYNPANIKIDLMEELQSLFEYYEAWADERRVTLELLGKASTRGDRTILRRALSNLLSNAIRHTPADTTVRVELKQLADQTVIVNVENPGQAIAPEHIPRIFDRFYRVDASRKREGEGVGLGLAIAKSIVELHNGKIEANSTETSTQFRITLPGPASA